MKFRHWLLASVSLAAMEFATPAAAQSGCANIVPGAVLTAAQWNQCFQNKQDALGFTPITTGNLSATAPLTLSVGVGVAQFGLSVGANLTVSAGALTTSGVPVLAGANIFTVAPQTINLNTASIPSSDTGTLLAAQSADGTISRVEATAAAAASTFTGRRADNTIASPTTLQSADLIATFNAHGYDGTSWSNLVAGAYRIYAEGTWSNSSHPTESCISTTLAGATSIADNFCVHNNGNATLTGSGALTLGAISAITGQLQLANSSSAFLTTIQAGNAAAARTYTWPTNFGAANSYLLDAAGNGTLSWTTTVPLRVPTITSLTSGSGAYSSPAGATYIEVFMCGPGGGGGASTTNSGGSGTITVFGAWTALSGLGGAVGGAVGAGGNGGSGGASGTGTLVYRVPGGSGSAGAGAAANVSGGGGNSVLGGAGGGTNTGAAKAATANSCSGGGGAANATVGAAGGGAGESVDFIVTAPVSVNYIVGTAGNGGSAGGTAGANGSAGFISIKEY